MWHQWNWHIEACKNQTNIKSHQKLASTNWVLFLLVFTHYAALVFMLSYEYFPVQAERSVDVTPVFITTLKLWTFMTLECSVRILLRLPQVWQQYLREEWAHRKHPFDPEKPVELVPLFFSRRTPMSSKNKSLQASSQAVDDATETEWQAVSGTASHNYFYLFWSWHDNDWTRQTPPLIFLLSSKENCVGSGCWHAQDVHFRGECIQQRWCSFSWARTTIGKKTAQTG